MSLVYLCIQNQLKSFQILFVLLSSLCCHPVHSSLSIRQKAEMLQPILYSIKLYFSTDNLEQDEIYYYLEVKVHFRLQEALDELVLVTRAQIVKIRGVYLNKEKFAVVEFYENPFFILRRVDEQLFPAGEYRIRALVVDVVTEQSRGVRFTLHRDRKWKDWSYSILLNFNDHDAIYTTLCLQNITAATRIKLVVKNDIGFHVYSIRQPVEQVIGIAPDYSSEFQQLKKFKSTDNSTWHPFIKKKNPKKPEKFISISYMYEMTMPLNCMVLYISENVRMTKGTPNFSATVTGAQNQVGKFSEEFRYILDLFYTYVKTYQTFGPRRLPLRYPDVFLHLHQNITDQVDTMHTHCLVSMLFVLQSHKNVPLLHSFLARCLASNHIMTRRYPRDMDSYYILLGLREYYAMFMRLEGGGQPADDDFTGLADNSVNAFYLDDWVSDQPLLGGLYEVEEYKNLNILRALCFINMLKHLIVYRKREKFDMIVSDFLNTNAIHFDRNSFMEVYQSQTQLKVFPSRTEISHFFDTWTYQYGYPIVHVYRTRSILHLSQTVSPFAPNVDPDQLFDIPVSIILEPFAAMDINKTHPNMWLVTRTAEATVDDRGMSKWFVINNQRTGYYRVSYDEWNYNLIRYELLRGDLDKFSAVTRGQILDDVLFLARIGRIRYGIALEVMEYLRREVHETPWLMAGSELQQLNFYLRYTSVFPLFKHFMKVLSRKFYRYKVEGVEFYSREAMKWACFGGLSLCLKFTNTALRGIIRNRESHRDLFGIICHGVKSVDEATFRYIKVSLLNTLESNERGLYLEALSCLNHLKFLKESLNVMFRRTSAIATSLTASEKLRIVLGMCSNTEEGAQAVLDFTFQHPVLVFRTMGAVHFKEIIQYMAKSMYKRVQQRRLRLILMYLDINDSDIIFEYMANKRIWIDTHLTYVMKLLSDYKNVEVTEKYVEF